MLIFEYLVHCDLFNKICLFVYGEDKKKKISCLLMYIEGLPQSSHS
jgi:hypothetical protein